MFCKYCGASIADDSVFCSSCGKNLKSEGTTQPVVEPEKKEIADTWFYHDDFRKGGPITYGEMVQKIKKREIDFDGEVKANKANSVWIPFDKSVFASTIKEIPARQIFISDKWVWCLAILPALIPIVLHKVGILPSQSIYDWIIGLGLNILFFMLDKKEIEDAGFFESWSYLGIVLVPLYLVMREVKTNHNYAPAIVNIFLFAVELFAI